VGFDGGVLMVAGFGVAFSPCLNVSEMDVWTKLFRFSGGDVSSHSELSSRTIVSIVVRLQLDEIQRVYTIIEY